MKTSNSAGPCTGRLRAELWDKLHFILGQTTDRMIRGEFWYEGLLETDLLRQAIQHITQAHPILHSAFRDKALRPYWEIMPYTIDDILTVIDADALTEQTEHELRIKAEEHGAEVEAESDRINRPAVGDVTDASDGAARLEQIRYDFMNQVIPVDHNVQYKVALINHRGKSLLCVLANHMVMDGRGGYSLFVQFAEAYSALKKGAPLPVIKAGSRAASMIYSGMNLWQKPRAWLLLKNITRLKEKRTFAFEPESAEDRLQMVVYKWDQTDAAALKDVAKKKHVTVTDVLLSCYMHALCQTCDFPQERPFTITCMVDNRKYIKPGKTIGVTNHVGLLQLKMSGCQESIDKTLRTVHSITKRKKNRGYIGLSGIPLIGLGYVLPFFIVKPGTRLWFTPPVLGFSNLGVIPHQPLAMGDVAIEDIMLMAPSQYKRHITIGIEMIHNTLVFTSAVRGSVKDKEKIQDLFAGMRECMRELAKSEM
ncbi:MAG: condensation domain-containing protein [Bacteroidales bacterium]